MAYAEVKGSRRKKLAGTKEMLVELGVALNSDLTGTSAYTHPARGSQPTVDGTATAASASTEFACTDIQENTDAVPGIAFITSTFERFVGYSE